MAIQSGLIAGLVVSYATESAQAAGPAAAVVQQPVLVANEIGSQRRDSASLDVRTTIRGSSAFTGVTWSPDGSKLATYANFGRLVQIWNSRGAELKQLSRAGAYIGRSIEFMPDGRTLITPAADDSAAGDKLAFSLWDVERGNIAKDVEGPQPAQNWRYNRAVAFALSPDGTTLALISSPMLGQPVTLYATKDWTKQRGIPIGDGPQHPDGAQAVAFSPDGHTLAIGLLGGKVMLTDLAQPDAPPRTIEIYPAANLTGVQALAFSPDGKLLATGSTKPSVARGDATPGVEVRRVSDGSLIAAHPAALAPIRQIVWSHDGKLVIGAGDDTVRLWSPLSPQNDLATLRMDGPVMSTAITPDGRSLAVAGGSEVKIISLSD
jgi:WD40 repeat protein